eukprot:CAMPEP_0171092914 /NCGR_PEP_ID=MMETSP0766_2-20121228/38050_1 /TAXON_ID=439317 /ORGANISM="Gambierdiscus australes, Strain CAWD 149" /LENGTH=187 /DNA_ID=CAMNT_0011551261 /DNA_START=38 /DNA_END=601 /DNA_ORIENTATION=+
MSSIRVPLAPREGVLRALVLAGASLLACLLIDSPTFTVSTPVGGSALASRLWVPPGMRTDCATAMRGRIKGVEPRRKPWVEPTVPDELAQEAAADGYRLRPVYSHMKVGYVVSDVNAKTRICHVEYFLFDAKYGAYYRRSKKKHYHDEYEISKLGDVVLITPWKKRSKMKHYRLVEVLKKNTAPVRV